MSDAEEYVDSRRERDARMAREDEYRTRRMEDEIEYYRSHRSSPNDRPDANRRPRSPPKERSRRNYDDFDERDPPRDPPHSNRRDYEHERPPRSERYEDPLQSTDGHNLGGFIRKHTAGDKRIKKPLLGALFKSSEEDQYNIRRPGRRPRDDYDYDDRRDRRQSKYDEPSHRRTGSYGSHNSYESDEEEPFPSSRAGSKEFYQRTDPRNSQPKSSSSRIDPTMRPIVDDRRAPRDNMRPRDEPPAGRRSRCDGSEQPKPPKRDRFSDEGFDNERREPRRSGGYDDRRPGPDDRRPKPSRIDSGSKPDRAERVRRLKEVQDEYRKSKISETSSLDDGRPPPPSRPRPQAGGEEDQPPQPPRRVPRPPQNDDDYEEEPRAMGRPPSYSEPLPPRPSERREPARNTARDEPPQLPRKPYRGPRTEKSEYPEYFEEDNEEVERNSYDSRNEKQVYERPPPLPMNRRPPEEFEQRNDNEVTAADYMPPKPRKSLVHSAQKLQQYDEPVLADQPQFNDFQPPSGPPPARNSGPPPPSRNYERSAPKLPSPPPTRGEFRLPSPPPARDARDEYEPKPRPPAPIPRKDNFPPPSSRDEESETEWNTVDEDRLSSRSQQSLPPKPAGLPPKPQLAPKPTPPKPQVQKQPPSHPQETQFYKPDLARKPTKVLPEPEAEDEAAFLTNARAKLRQSRIAPDLKNSEPEREFTPPDLRPPSPRRVSAPKPSEAVQKMQELRAAKPVLKPKPEIPEALQRRADLKPARSITKRDITPAEALETRSSLRPKSQFINDDVDPNLEAITAQLRKMKARGGEPDDFEEPSNDSSESLSHLTKSRSRGPKRRPPTLD